MNSIQSSKIRLAFDLTGTDKGYCHGYDRWYDRVFKNYTPQSLLEIGVMQGRSLAAWKLVFPKCSITGVDIQTVRMDNRFVEMADAKIIIADSTKPNIVDRLDGIYDVIIDDGSHFYKHIIETFENLKDQFKYAYIIEDAMYNHDQIIQSIKKLGFTKIEVYDSHNTNIPVNTSWLKTNEYGDVRDITQVDLKMIVVYRD